MNYDLRLALNNLKLGCEDLREDLWAPRRESNSFSAQDLALQEQSQKTNDDFEDFNSKIDESENILDLTTAVESLQSKSIKLSPVEEAGLRLTMMQLRSYRNKQDNGILAKESFGNGNFLTLAHEDLKSKFKEAADSVVETVKKIWEKVITFLKNIFDQDKKLIKKAEHLIEVFSNTNVSAGIEIPYKKSNSNITLNKELDAKILKTILAKLSRLYDGHTLALSSVIQNSNDMTEEQYKNKVMAVIKHLTESIWEDADTYKAREAKITINDSWALIAEGKGDFYVPILKRDVINKVESVKTIDETEIKSLLKDVITVLGINADQDLRTADTIVRKLKFKKDFGEEVTSVIGLLGRFIIERSSLRYNVCRDFIVYFDLCLKASTKGTVDDKS